MDWEVEVTTNTGDEYLVPAQNLKKAKRVAWDISTGGFYDNTDGAWVLPKNIRSIFIRELVA